MNETKTQEPVVRAAEEADLEGVLALRRAAYGADVASADRRFYQWQYGENPAGSAAVTVVDLDGRIVGELGSLPTRFQFADRTMTANLYVNFIVHPDLRGRGIGPAIDRVQRRQELDRGQWLMLGFIRISNAPQWRVQVEKLGRTVLAKPAMYYRVVHPVPLARAALGPRAHASLLGALAAVPLAVWNRATHPGGSPGGIEVRELDSAVEEIDALWARLAPAYRCAVVKDRRFCEWRYFRVPDRSYRVFGAYAGATLRGLAVTRVTTWETLRLGVLLDLLVEPSDDAAAGALVGRSLEAIGADVDAVSCMLHARGAAVRALRRAGFFRVPSRMNPHGYVFLGQALDGREGVTEWTAPADGCLSWGDFDVF